MPVFLILPRTGKIFYLPGSLYRLPIRRECRGIFIIIPGTWLPRKNKLFYRGIVSTFINCAYTQRIFQGRCRLQHHLFSSAAFMAMFTLCRLFFISLCFFSAQSFQFCQQCGCIIIFFLFVNAAAHYIIAYQHSNRQCHTYNQTCG